jgi:hypothetical protein
MKWRVNEEKESKEPKLGDTKKVTKFAYLPVKIGSHKVWLETYRAEYKYQKYQTKKIGTSACGFLDDEIITKTGWRIIGKRMMR